ncbi:diguanylate cyclase [Neptunomonas sp. CHC150]|uniref:GGDEF domain-containing protein n=1 Tax=Neptunomonas sp. CHC150 TaxID=2998324 RepID=UPI0025AFD1E9|nr:GGDEF domain-containing protein [Neptunomonas sp. CHC150]MDN2659936.1 diguanylate cyclase [Neptunomonas sp. CHC150]
MATKDYKVSFWNSVALMALGGIFVFEAAKASDNNDKYLTPVTLQLQWYHQFQFAGYYAALHKGFYEAAGLDVTIKDGGYDAKGNAIIPEAEVVFNRAQFGITRTDLLINHSQGLPVAVIANVMQHSPYVFMTLKDYGFSSLEEIGLNRPVTLNLPSVSDGRNDAEAMAALKVAHVEPAWLNNRFPTWKIEDLLNGTTELMPAYVTDGPFFVEKEGRTPLIISPEDYGIDFYGDLIFTSVKMIEQQPDIVKSFRDASLQGWKYALEHPAEIVSLIHKEYRTRNENYDLEFLIYESAEIKKLINPDVIEVGYMNPLRWEKIAKTYQSLGLIREYDIESLLYIPPANHPLSGYIKWVKLLVLPLIISLIISAYLYSLTRRLRKEIARRREAEATLKIQAERDALTGLDNRYAFQRNFSHEFERARRYKQPFSLVMIDIDFFKEINDKFGHLAGDEVLKSLANVTSGLLRGSDQMARYGGEEFVILLPNTLESEAMALAERILRANQSNCVLVDGHSLQYTISLGVTELSDEDQSINDLFKRSDQLLYEAKDAGRNCIRRYVGKFVLQ